jgi:hypothetical protein
VEGQGRLALAVAVLALLVAAAPASATSTFNGTTAQSQPFVMTMSTSGRTVQLRFAYEVSCTSGLSFTDAETVNAPAHPYKKGRRLTRVKFSASGAGPIQARTQDGQTVKGSLDMIVTGNISLGTGRATGRIEPTITLSNFDTCTSGNVPIRWNAIIGAPPPPAPAS